MSTSSPSAQPSSIPADSAENVIRNATFENARVSNPSISEFKAPTSESILSAYSQPSSLHPLSNLNSDLDYLSLDDSALSSIAGSQSVLPNRGWSDELCYGTGTVYVGGLVLGGFWGLKEGWSRGKVIAAGRVSRSLPPSSVASSSSRGPQGVAGLGVGSSGTATVNSVLGQGSASAAYSGAVGSVSWRLRLNSILNGITRRGSFVGNTTGVLALMYNVFNCTLDRYRGQHDNWNSIMAGGLTGALFRCTAGPQKMLIASFLMAAGAMGWSTMKPTLI